MIIASIAVLIVIASLASKLSNLKAGARRRSNNVIARSEATRQSIYPRCCADTWIASPLALQQ